VRIFVLGSGSSGNAVIVEEGDDRVLIDCGMGPKQAVMRMRELGADLFPRGVSAIVITHDHHDHIAHLESHARALKVPVYLHRGIAAQRVRHRFEVRDFEARAPFTVGCFTVEALVVPHDAAQVALRVATRHEAFGHVTDLGHVPRDLAPFLGECDMALIEANYCPELLHFGPYPPRLKRRVSGGYGHLANHEAGALAASLVGTRVRKVLLGHVSRANNSPQRALAVVEDAVKAASKRYEGRVSVELVDHGIPARFDFAGLPPRGAQRPTQLAFGF
jgi:phosphoribosyl 1,2-cyclic phosphodiesterase